MGIAHATDQTPVKITNPVEHIHQSAGFIIRHRIDGKIPALQILGQIIGKRHFLRVSGVFIYSVYPVSCNLVPGSVHEYRHGSVLYPGIDGPSEDLLDLRRRRRSRYIPVIRLPPQDRIPDAAAYGIRFITCRFKFPYYIVNILRQVYMHILFPAVFSQISRTCNCCPGKVFICIPWFIIRSPIYLPGLRI